jgi:conjugal transfer pilus assembly protein TraL
MNEKKYRIPQHLDNPMKIILWTIDEFLIFLIPFAILMFGLNSPITGVVMGGLLMMGLKYIKGEQGHYFMYNLMYWYLPPVFILSKTPPSYIRIWIG